MPRVRLYVGGAVERTGTTDAKLRAVDNGASGLAVGLQAAGGALADVAEVEAQIAERRDMALVKQIDAEAEAGLADIRARYTSTEKFGAVGARKAAEQEIGKLKNDFAGKLTNPRQQRMFGEVFTARVGRDLAAIAQHETGQILVAEKDASAARVGSYVERAVQLRDDPEASVDALATAHGELEKLHGSAGPDVVALKKAELTSGFHVRVADALLDESPEKAKAWVDRHAAQILEADETAIRRRLIPGLEEGELDAGMDRLEEILADGPPAEVPDMTAPRAERAKVAAVNADPLRGRGRVTATPEQHVKRGRVAVDIAAAPGTPIYPPMGGRVVDKGFDPNGNGHFVRVKHSNGVTTTYLHMKAASAFGVGDEVSGNSVLGGVGSTGRSTGPHLDYSAKDAKGRAIDPTKVKWEEGPLPALPTVEPERADKLEMYRAAHRVATERNYSRKQYDALLRRVDAVVARTDNLKARVDEDNVKAALDVVERLGPAFNRRDQIRNWSALPPETRMRLQGMIEQNTRPKPVEANGDGVLSLELASIYEPERFAATDLRQFRHTMTEAEFGALAKKQAQIRTQGSASPIAVSHSAIWGMINRYGADVGLKPQSDDPDERKRSMRVFDMSRRLLEQVTGGKRQPNDDEVKAAFDAATMEVTVRGGGWFGGDAKARRFDAQPGAQLAVQVPNNVRARIVDSYRRQFGRAPDGGEVFSIYMANKGKAGFW